MNAVASRSRAGQQARRDHRWTGRSGRAHRSLFAAWCAADDDPVLLCDCADPDCTCDDDIIELTGNS